MPKCPEARRLATALVICLAISAFAGCEVVQQSAELPARAVRAVTGDKEEPALDPVVIQQDLIRFADHFLEKIEHATEVQDANASREVREALQEARLELTSRIVEIASGPNSIASLIDMVGAVMLARRRGDQDALEALPESARDRICALLAYEEEHVLELARKRLDKEQLERLQKSVDTLLANPELAAGGLLSGYTVVSEDAVPALPSDDAPASLLSVLMLDPLANLDPTVREMTQARLFAERAMFVAQHMPDIIRMQVELLLHAPAIDQTLDQVNQVAMAGERIGRLADELPALISEERAAVVRAIEEQSKPLEDLLAQAQATLSAATETVESTDRFLDHLGVYDPESEAESASGGSDASESPTPREPFRIEDYTAAASQLADTAEQLTELIESTDSTLRFATSAEFEERLSTAKRNAEEVVDHLFWRAVALFALCCVMVLGAIAVNRAVIRRIGRRGA